MTARILEVVSPTEGGVVVDRAVDRAPRVLVVDDDGHVLRVIRRHLAAARYDVRLVEDPVQAIEVCLAEDFDLVVCDVNMPGKSGLAVFEEVVRVRPELAGKFVFMSAGPVSSSLEAFLESTACRRYDKGWELAKISAVVAEELARRSAPGRHPA